MKAKVLSYIREQKLLVPGERVLCALSGGADSMALLWCLCLLREELEITLEAAHFNHRLRGAAAQRDEEAVRAFCARHAIPLSVGNGDVAAYARAEGLGIEEAARILRYDFLKSLPHDKLATAHHAGDNAETVLMHLLRGSGLRGLRGIEPKAGKLVRPLLSCTREEILAFLQQEGMAWQEDESNGEDGCLRNRLRHHVLPRLLEEEPGLFSKITAQSELLRREDELLDRLAGELLEKAKREEGYHCPTLLQAPAPLQGRALRLLLRDVLPQDVSRSHTDALLALLKSPSPSAQMSLPRGTLARRRYDCLEITQDSPLVCPQLTLPIPGTVEIPGLQLVISCHIEEITEKFEKNANTPFHFALKYDMIPQSISSLSIRPRREQDRICLNGCSKSVKKLFIERKIPRWEREGVPIITDGANLLGIPGIGPDCRYAPAYGDLALIIHIEKKETEYASRHRTGFDL